VEFFVDGALLDTVLRPVEGLATTYVTLWPAGLAAPGDHTISVRASDTSGNFTATTAVTVSVDNLANAVFDTVLGAPACDTVGSFCDTGALIEGRGTVGPEENAPNTLGTCFDGDSGVFHQDESLDRIRVSSVDGLSLESGKRARVQARVWAFTAWGDDRLDLYYTNKTGELEWKWFATLAPTGPGAQTLTAEYVLPPGGMQAVRGRYRFSGYEAACSVGSYDDHDDVAFAVEYTPNAAYDAVLKVPACNTVGPYCDSGTLLDGRAALGPEQHAPNTLGSTCADGTVGTYHADPSVDGLLVQSGDMTALTAGQLARVEVSVYASGAHYDERVQLFRCANPAAATPVWTYVQTLLPVQTGAHVLVGSVPVTAGTQAIRARMLNVATAAEVAACGTTGGTEGVDDQDDLVFTADP
jgi:hypothetical protein